MAIFDGLDKMCLFQRLGLLAPVDRDSMQSLLQRHRRPHASVVGKANAKFLVLGCTGPKVFDTARSLGCQQLEVNRDAYGRDLAGSK
jgi:hypothetical protein